MDSAGGLAVLTVLQMPQDNRTRIRRPLPKGQRLWLLALLDVMAVAWMIAAGSWLEETSWLTSVITLGGHHKLIMTLAILSFAILAVLAVTTENFTWAHSLEMAFLSVAGVMTLVAIAGILSVVILVIGAGCLIGLVGRLLLR